MRASTCLACLFAALTTVGCGRRIFYEWRDEPYLRPCFKAGEEEAHRRMSSRFADERDIGCRALSIMGREAARAGDAQKAREVARALITHYPTETSLDVRATIVAVCVRNVGAGDEAVSAFLKERLATHDMVACAAYSLATLKPPGCYETIRRAYDAAVHTGNYDLRYEILGALWLLADARAIRLYEDALREVPRSWPKKIHHMKKATYERALRSRLETLRIACAD
jgi:hypothetical protein